MAVLVGVLLVRDVGTELELDEAGRAVVAYAGVAEWRHWVVDGKVNVVGGHA